MNENVKKVIEEHINPMLAQHGGACEFVGVTTGNVVQVKLKGACGSCPGAMMTLKGFVREVLKQHVPEVVDVEPV